MSDKKSTELLQFDHDHIWHPYASMTNPNPVYPIESADGVYLKLMNGQSLIDGMSSWWAAIHGYNHPVLNKALIEQSQKMSHVMFGGLTHEPAINLAKKLIDLTAADLNRVFFADSGSVAVEVAIKMAFQYWIAQKKFEKVSLLTVRNGYHGDTFMAMSVCDPVNGMHHQFKNIIAQQFFAESPDCDKSDHDKTNIDSVDKILQKHHQTIAAVIIEPLVQGAGGMRFYCPEYLQQLDILCKQYKVLLIFDEIATGFGRSGTLFAYEQANVTPDILCLGKALTGGYMTLAAVMCNDKVVNGIHHQENGVLMHGPTFMANPLACAVASASIDLLVQSDWKNKVNFIEQKLLSELSPCISFSAVKEVRVKGAIGVVELYQSIDMKWISEFFIREGVWIRPFNNLIYLMPPFIINQFQLNQLCQSIIKAIKYIEQV